MSQYQLYDRFGVGMFRKRANCGGALKERRRRHAEKRLSKGCFEWQSQRILAISEALKSFQGLSGSFQGQTLIGRAFFEKKRAVFLQIQAPFWTEPFLRKRRLRHCSFSPSLLKLSLLFWFSPNFCAFSLPRLLRSLLVRGRRYK